MTQHPMPAPETPFALWVVKPGKSSLTARFPEDYSIAQNSSAPIDISELQDGCALTETDWSRRGQHFSVLVQRGLSVSGAEPDEALKAFVRLTPALQQEILSVARHPVREQPEMLVTALLLGAAQALKIRVPSAALQLIAEAAVRTAPKGGKHEPWSSEDAAPAFLSTLDTLTKTADPLAHWQAYAETFEQIHPSFLLRVIHGWALARGFERHMRVQSKLSALEFATRHPQDGPLQATVIREGRPCALP